MPHLRLEYSPGLEALTDMSALCAALHGAMLKTGIFPLSGIRVRTHRCAEVFVADGHAANHFVAMELIVGTGRTRDVLERAGAQVFAAAKAALAPLLAQPHLLPSLEIREMDANLVWRANSIRPRLGPDA
ncbi:5-carboxymethyl-2-hydroxymuconate Delta-isomerase [Maliponia aquimaris]|uniref:5-carboxymethyl-2-hydroxymuconate Delta-isomerase n=1 Tax=Maliponia aquimaris TaxID=1673631 RepID=A0A238KKA9_9RHOB|nr:5-carboxymethyl-2-hydroxymuconate Delta-isomerase [Maliponia aquimaris]SMX43148.1 5-carboxymethyl-2-hydroxymuconate Delta-isomerase [Maliponia aquimaris]